MPTDVLHVFAITAERLGDQLRSKGHPHDAGRLEDCSFTGIQALKLERDRFLQVDRHRQKRTVTGSAHHPATVRLRQPAAPDQFLRQGDDEERIPVAPIVNHRGQVLYLAAEPAAQILAHICRRQVVEREIPTAAVRQEGLLELADGMLADTGFGRTIRPDHEQPGGIGPLRERR